MDKLKAFETFASVATRGSLSAAARAEGVAPAGFGRRHVAPLVPAFHAEHPRLRISLNLSDRVVELAAEGYDCAVRVGDLPDSSLVSIRLADNRRQAVAAPAYLARRGTPQHPRDLARHDCLVLSSDASQTRGWAFRVPRNAVGRNDERTPKGADVPRHAVGRDDERTLAGAGAPNEAESELTYLRPGGPPDCSDGQVLHDWCLAGHGIAWRSTWEVEGEIAAGLLVPVLEDFAAPPNGIYAILPHATRHLPLRVRLWVDFLRQRYGDPAFWRAAAQADS